MLSRVAGPSLIVTIALLLSSCEDGGRTVQGLFNLLTPGWRADARGTGALFKVASKVESVADRLSSQSFAMFNPSRGWQDNDTQSCDLENTAVITVYSTNGMAQSEIDVKLDGSPIGSLTTYFPDDQPGCKSPSAEGVITIMVPAGDHTLEAASPNLTWPTHGFSVEKCGCILLPLS